MDDCDYVSAFHWYLTLWVAGDTQGLGQIVLGDPLYSRALAAWTSFRPPRIDPSRIKARAAALVAEELKFNHVMSQCFQPNCTLHKHSNYT
jgi:hypothetical protein